MTYQNAAKMAIDVQDACNLSGIVFAFADAMRAICDESHRLGQGTDWRNTNPVVIAFLDKLNSLARIQPIESDYISSVDRAFSECERIVNNGGAR